MWTKTPSSITGKYLPNYRQLYNLAVNNSLTPAAKITESGHNPLQEFRDRRAAFLLDGSWAWDEIRGTVPNASLIPYYCGVEGEEEAGPNCGTLGCNWAANAGADPEDRAATLDFMHWCVTNPEASAILVSALGAMPYAQAATPDNDLLAVALQYTAEGRYPMNWAYIFQPNADAYREGLVQALTLYSQDQSDASWDFFHYAFVEGWAQQYREIHESGG